MSRFAGNGLRKPPVPFGEGGGELIAQRLELRDPSADLAEFFLRDGANSAAWRPAGAGFAQDLHDLVDGEADGDGAPDQMNQLDGIRRVIQVSVPAANG